MLTIFLASVLPDFLLTWEPSHIWYLVAAELLIIDAPAVVLVSLLCRL